MIFQRIGRVEGAVPSGRHVGNAGIGCLAQRFEAGPVLGLPPLDQSQALAQDLAGILVAARTPPAWRPGPPDDR